MNNLFLLLGTSGASGYYTMLYAENGIKAINAATLWLGDASWVVDKMYFGPLENEVPFIVSDLPLPTCVPGGQTDSNFRL